MLIKDLTIWGYAREYCGLERKQLCAMANIHYTTIQAFESGRYTPSRRLANKLLSIFEQYDNDKLHPLIEEIKLYINNLKKQ